MSCGRPHETPCSEVLDAVFEYLDHEMADPYRRAKIEQHLDECGPCLERYGLEKVVKALVRRSCGHDEVPAELRGKVLAKIRAVRIEIETRDAL
jgi:mycothiol system anti-sigma-R factor